MKVIVSPANYLNALDLIRINTHYLLIGQEGFSVRKNYDFSNDELEKIINQKQNTKILILVNRTFFEEDIEPLTKYLVELSKLKIDGIVFSDFAVVQICKEHKLNFEFFYNPETLVTNYGQFEFYLKNKINNVFVSRELRINEVKQILDNKQQMNVGMQCSGYSFIMESKWKMIENFNQEYNLQIPLNKKLYLKEETRDFPTIIYQDKYGTYLYTSYCLSIIKQLIELSTKPDYLFIDSFLHDEQWVEEMTQLYLEICNDPSNTSKYLEMEKEICKNESINSGFLGDTKNMVYLREEEHGK